MKSQKEINLDDRILSLLKPEKLGGAELPYAAAKKLIDDPEITAMQDYANTDKDIRRVEKYQKCIDYLVGIMTSENIPSII